MITHSWIIIIHNNKNGKNYDNELWVQKNPYNTLVWVYSILGKITDREIPVVK